MTSRETYIQQLDGLRGLAVLIVLVSHISNATGLLGGTLGFGAGQLGVMLFFVLSGFLMAHVTWTKEFTSENVGRFFVHRASRVLPLFIGVVLVDFALGQILGGRNAFGIDTIPILIDHLTLKSGNAILWTISVEIFFYAVFPVFWFLQSRSPMTLILGLIVSAAGMLFLRDVELADPPAWMRLLWTGQFFLFGIAAYAVRTVMDDVKHASFLLAFLLALFFLHYPSVQAALFGDRADSWGQPTLYVIVPAIVLFCTYPGLSDRLFGGITIRWVGQISYSVYLIHLFWLDFLKSQFGWHHTLPWVFAAFVIVAALASAAVSFYAFERPVRRLINAYFVPTSPRASEAGLA